MQVGFRWTEVDSCDSEVSDELLIGMMLKENGGSDGARLRSAEVQCFSEVMPEDIEDDVPVYFSPDDEDGTLASAPDRQSLLEDVPPRDWEPYKPSMTLEQASRVAKESDEERFRRPGSLPPSEGEDDQKSEGSKNQGSRNTSRFNSTQDGMAALPVPGTRDPNDPTGDAADAHASEQGLDSQERTAKIAVSKSNSLSRISDRKLRILLVVAAVNVFAIGFWCGSFLFPNRRVVTSLYDVTQPGPARDTREAALSKSGLSSVVAGVEKAVVNVDVRSGYKDSASSYGGTSPEPLQSVQRIFSAGGSSSASAKTQSAGGVYEVPSQSQASGIIISSDGYILTNSHVLKPGAEIRVTMSDGKEFRGSIVGRDAFSDLAVLKIVATNLPVVRFGDISTVRPGDWAIAIGSPFGFDHSVTVGTVSGLNRIVGSFNHHIPLIQTDAAINPGSSGGPIFNVEGKVIGVICAAVTSSAEGLAFAIPVDVASDVAKQLIEKGSVPRAYIGLKMMDLDPDRKRAHTLPSHPVAVVVHSVMMGGPAAAAGVRQGDTILRVDGKVVKSGDEVRAILTDKKPGDSIKLILKRAQDGSTHEADLKLADYPSNL